MRGFILAEASVVYAILALALVALLPLFVLCYRSSEETAHIATATQLSSELIEEIRLRKWDQSTPSPPRIIDAGSRNLGPDPGEPAGNKRFFNDVDDFNGWAEESPLDPAMQPIEGVHGYARTVTVDYVDTAHPDLISKEPTDLKRVTACSRWRAAAPVCLQALFANR